MAPWPYPLWIAHRGAGKLAPENTLAAFRVGASHGYRAFECDVKLSADGVPILMHDSALRRTTGVDRAVATVPWSEIAELDAGAWFDRGFAGERVPSFETAIACLEEQQLGANIEIKPCAIREAATAIAVAETLRRSWPACRRPWRLRGHYNTGCSTSTSFLRKVFHTTIAGSPESDPAASPLAQLTESGAGFSSRWALT